MSVGAKPLAAWRAADHPSIAGEPKESRRRLNAPGGGFFVSGFALLHLAA
jgi:hypothetical protein